MGKLFIVASIFDVIVVSGFSEPQSGLKNQFYQQGTLTQQAVVPVADCLEIGQVPQSPLKTVR